MSVATVKMTERGELPLPSSAQEALNGAGYVTVETSFGSIALRPADSAAPRAVPVCEGVVTLPEDELKTIFGFWRFEDDRSYEAVTESAGYVVLGPPDNPEGMARARRQFAGKEPCETAVNNAFNEAKQERYEAGPAARAPAERRKTG